MASSSTHETATVQSTRQLLDELDELMERMLALPIEDADQPPPAQPVAATLTLLESPTDAAAAADATAPASGPDVVADGTLPQYLIAIDEPAAAASAAELPATITSAGVPEATPLLPLPQRLQPRPSLSYQFLLWINGGYDRGTFWLGRRGNWLRGRAFRWVLGFFGLALLAAAAAWVVWDWFGWQR